MIRKTLPHHLLFFAVVAACALLLWRYSTYTAPSEVAPGTLDSTAPVPAAPVSGSQGDTAPAPVAPGDSGNQTFSLYIKEEAAAMNATKVDEQAALQRMRDQAARMGAAELKEARELVLDTKATANSRILAASLLGMTGKQGWPAMKEIALREHNSARAEPHSLDELKNTQAKALSLMQVDALAAQARHDSGAREELRRWEAEAKDPTIRAHIQKSLRELPPL